jgi:hypothetical protein
MRASGIIGYLVTTIKKSKIEDFDNHVSQINGLSF